MTDKYTLTKEELATLVEAAETHLMRIEIAGSFLTDSDEIEVHNRYCERLQNAIASSTFSIALEN